MARAATAVPHFLDVDDLSREQLRKLLDEALQWKGSPASVPHILEGRSVAAYYEKPSARTRVSFEVAITSLGGHPVTLRPEEIGLGEREATADVARMLSGYCAVVGARVYDHRTLEELAEASEIPVINLLSDKAHPCQTLADLLTLEEVLGGLEGCRVAFVGDGNNVAASLAIGAALTGFELTVASPPGYELSDATRDRARRLGGRVEVTSYPVEAVAGAHAVYTDVWTSMGQESEAQTRLRAFAPYQVTRALMEAARPDAFFLHCLPAHRGEEVTAEVIDGPASVVWRQAENRMHVARGLLAHVARISGCHKESS